MLTKFERETVIDRLEGWELVEFLQIPIEQVVAVAIENDWIDDDNLEDLLDFVGLRKEP